MAQINRRGFLKASSAAVAALPVAGCIAHPFPVRSPYASAIPSFEPGAVVNDIHSQLNATRVDRIVKPRTVEELRTAIASARSAGKPVSIAGGRHAMGGQQFAEAGFLVDTRAMNHVLAFDDERGVIVVEGGIQWPDLVEYLNTAQEGRERQWGIYQKQTGADRLSIAGALACNAHGRGLNLKPIVDQVQAFDLIGPDGGLRTCSRTENPKLFRLAIGGYGLFGAISRVELKLRPRVKVRRVVAIGETPTIIERFEARIRDGYQYGDYQFATDSNRESFLGRGVFSCYQPVPSDTPLTQNPTRFNPEDWANLTFYSHTHKKLAFDTYTRRYLATYGTVRMIEPDDETFLAWARDRYACVVLNLHVEHTPQAIDEAAESFRQLIDLGIKHGGSYYLTYHRWARKDQVEACYPQMREFLALKREYDPDEVFQSTWYRHYRDMFATE
jgi:FAD/FMN-containing dehydrogenase